MAISFLTSRNRVHDETDVFRHRRLCRCRSCKKKRGSDFKVAITFLAPLFGIMMVVAIFV